MPADVPCSLLQQQAYPGAPPPYQQYYQGYPNYPPYPYPQQQKSSGGGLPFYVWIGVGALVMWGYSKISGLVRGGPQAAQAKMMSWVRATGNDPEFVAPAIALQGCASAIF